MAIHPFSCAAFTRIRTAGAAKSHFAGCRVRTRQIMHEQKLLAVAIVACAAVALGSCRGRDSDQSKNPDESELSRSSASPRGAPGNPRGPTDPSR
jgi:hypothetical protein